MKHAFGRLTSCAVAFGFALASWSAGAAEPPPPPFGPRPVARGGTEELVSPRQPEAELVYKPIAPCRAINGQGLATNQTKNFQITGVCGVPSYAKAVAINLSANATSGGGHLTAFATGTAKPSIVSLSVSKDGTETAGSTVALGPDGNMSVYAKSGAKINGDITGYFAQQIEGMIANDGSIYSGGTGIVSATVVNPGIYRVTVDRDVTYCTPVVTPYSGKGVYASVYGFAGNAVYIYTWYLSGSTHLEVSNSYYVYLAIHC